MRRRATGVSAPHSYRPHSRKPHSRKWLARIKHRGTEMVLGEFDSELQAARAIDGRGLVE
ncbi:hypothetical protein EMIHUDRAFT_235669 [Emiliania huxleyi CCMP1516]|uniref:AP2/ERF domain-containing protein n=2 Tax=Emiliania huxleyi TaxID=2903 RepID=A0A0D3JVL3_EMIH1|nr:hypothetical protein EMIHUDRAFT_235669 [Emiliania huxleyi CCMP1516]EOD27548.1 hypothetical protein EMIHUDRAFT_235669 [Emiliania huxleyi CCMP1516]|eukprot:XP_005779977.1 hypothetical protein EMIHUDRAFT_235669 [Emiliania huxleyi CCMP1516]